MLFTFVLPSNPPPPANLMKPYEFVGTGRVYTLSEDQ